MNRMHASFDFATLPQADVYKLLASTILPRPIAWITTRAADGTVNAAPFSFFNVVSADPPLVAVCFSKAPDRAEKDTLLHIRETGEFVVNMVPMALAEAMNVTATNAPLGMDETRLAKLEVAACVQVNTQRLAASPVAFECVHFQTIEPGGSSTIVLGRVVHAHIAEAAFEDRERLYIDPHKLDLIGRMAGTGGYCTTRDQFHIERLSWPLEKP